MDNKTIAFAVKGLIISNGMFLAVHKSNIKSEKFELPGGRMIFGETAEETLIREVHEEVGLIVNPIKLIDTWNYKVNDTNQITGIIYLCECEDTSNILLSNEHDFYEWMDTSIDSLSKMNRLFRPQMEKWDWDELKSSSKRML